MSELTNFLSLFWSRYSRLGLTTALTLASIDQLHKWWMLNVLDITSSTTIQVFPFLNLVYVSNKGISFGMLQQDDTGQLLLVIFSVIICLVLMVWLAQAGQSSIMAVAIGLIIGGAIGNAIDRLHLGGVADFFDFHALGYHWPAFNIADIAIVLGCVILMFNSFTAD
ncbi:MAG TPA: Lipoprotein signal peptidase [Hyphomicrobiaceae bacterium MAG_BT-2024]